MLIIIAIRSKQATFPNLFFHKVSIARANWKKNEFDILPIKVRISPMSFFIKETSSFVNNNKHIRAFVYKYNSCDLRHLVHPTQTNESTFLSPMDVLYHIQFKHYIAFVPAMVDLYCGRNWFCFSVGKQGRSDNYHGDKQNNLSRKVYRKRDKLDTMKIIFYNICNGMNENSSLCIFIY